MEPRRVRRLRFATFAVILLPGLVYIASLLRFVGFHYPVEVDNQPLTNPVAVTIIVGPAAGERGSVDLYLADGRRVVLGEPCPDVDLLTCPPEVELVGSGGRLVVYARTRAWHCGTPWAQPVVIPLIPDRLARWQRVLVGEAVVAAP